MLVSHFMITYLPAIGKLKGSFLLPAHWEGGARATLKMIAPQKNFRAKPKQAGKKEGGWGGRNFCPPAFERRHGGRGVWGEFRHAGANTKRGRTRRPASQEQKPAKKFSFPFRRKKSARANQKI